MVERKSFDLSLEGRGVDLLRITENGFRRRVSVVLSATELRWLVGVWKELWREEVRAGWFRRRRDKDRTLMFQVNQNRWGRMVVLSVLKNGDYHAVVCPEGLGKAGWRDLSNAVAELARLAEVAGRVPKVVSTIKEGLSERRMEREHIDVNFRNLTAGKEDWRKIRMEICCLGCGKKLLDDIVIGGVMTAKKTMAKNSVIELVTGEGVGGEMVGRL